MLKRVGAILLSMMLAWGCGGGGDTSAPPATPDNVVAPLVVSFYPTSDGSYVWLNSMIYIEMSKDMDPFTIVPDNIQVTQGDAKLAITLSLFDGRFICLKSTKNFTPSLPVTVRMNKGGVKDLAGKSLRRDFIFSFPTAKGNFDLDIQPPSVMLRSPADQAEDIPVDASILITFDEALDPTSVHLDNFLIKDLDATAVTGKTVYVKGRLAFYTGVPADEADDAASGHPHPFTGKDPECEVCRGETLYAKDEQFTPYRTVKFTPESLKENTHYEVEVLGVYDMAGNVITAPTRHYLKKKWSFTTAALPGQSTKNGTSKEGRTTTPFSNESADRSAPKI
jgi:hypothetical protein